MNVIWDKSKSNLAAQNLSPNRASKARGATPLEKLLQKNCPKIAEIFKKKKKKTCLGEGSVIHFQYFCSELLPLLSNKEQTCHEYKPIMLKEAFPNVVIEHFNINCNFESCKWITYYVILTTSITATLTWGQTMVSSWLSLKTSTK